MASKYQKIVLGLMLSALIFQVQTLFSEEMEHDFGQHDFWVDQKSIKPFVEFYSIGSLFPHSSFSGLIASDRVIEQWHQLKPYFQKIVARTGDERSADALLVIACGTWLYDKNSGEAINLLESVISDHPSATTILSVEPFDWCPLRLNLHWYFYLEGVLKGEADKGNPISKRTEKALQERMMFVEHVKEYPSLASDVASLFIVCIASREKDYVTVEKSLNRVLDRHSFENMNRSKHHDKKAAYEPNGIALLSLRRPEITATMLLARQYDSRGKSAEACSLVETLANAVSGDGFYYDINMYAGDLLRKKEDASQKAERQYRVALSGYLERVQQRIEEEDTSSIDHLPSDAWRKKIKSMKSAIRDAGGDIEIDAKELESIIEQKEKSKPESSFDQDTVREAFKKMYSGKGKYADPKERERGASDLVNMMKKEEAKITKENREDIKKLRKSLAIGLAGMAVVDEDADVRIAMVDSVNEIIQPQAEYEADPISDTDKQKVDDLLAQIIGKETEKPVPYPETNLADMNPSALLYAATQVKVGSLSLEAKRLVVKALANSESPVLYTFFGNLVRNTEDVELKKLAVRGLGRIVKNADIDDNGTILM